MIHPEGFQQQGSCYINSTLMLLDLFGFDSFRLRVVTGNFARGFSYFYTSYVQMDTLCRTPSRGDVEYARSRAVRCLTAVLCGGIRVAGGIHVFGVTAVRDKSTYRQPR